MDDVRVRSGLPRQRENECDRINLSLMWTAGQVARIRTRVAGRRVDVLRQLGMNEQRRTGSVQRVQCGFDFGRIETSELRHARIDEKTFESAYTGIEHRPKLIDIPRHRAAPQRDVDAAFAVKSMHLRLERGHRGSGRDGVQRHVDDRRHSARRRRMRSRLESLPLRPPRFVDVHMRIDDARHERELAEIDCIGSVIEVRDAFDDTVTNVDRRGTDAVRRHDIAAAKDHAGDDIANSYVAFA